MNLSNQAQAAAQPALAPMSKSARTRARLLDCAISVFSRKGVDNAAISEIASEAGLANGTFYIYFRDKAEVVAAVVDHIVTQLFRRISIKLDDDWSAAERLSFVTREFIVQATHEREWGFTMFRSLASVPELRHTASGYFLPFLQEGAAHSEFETPPDAFLGNMIATMNMTAVSSCLRDETRAFEIGMRVAEYQLRMLGLPGERAREIASSDLGVTVYESSGGPNSTDARG